MYLTWLFYNNFLWMSSYHLWNGCDNAYSTNGEEKPQLLSLWLACVIICLSILYTTFEFITLQAVLIDEYDSKCTITN